MTAHLQGRPGAFQELYDRYRDRLVHFITRKTGDPDRAQDLVQEAFIRVTRHLHRFDTSKKFSTWVYTIASNLSKNELRNRSRSPLVLFQRLTNNWEDDHRPLQFEDYSMRPDDLYRKRYLRRLVEDTGQGAPRAPSARLPPAGAGGEELRGDRRDHRREPRDGEEPAAPGAATPSPSGSSPS